MTRVFAFGHSVVDFVYRLDKLPDQGKKYYTHDAYIIGGGCAANAAVAIRKLNGDVVFGTRVGSDVIGDLIVNDLKSYGLELSLINRQEGSKSSFSSVAIDSDGERQIINFRGEGLVKDTEWIENAPTADAYLTDTSWPKGAKKVLELARQRDIAGIADVEHLTSVENLQAASHVAFSRQGLEKISQTPDPIEGLKRVKVKLNSWTCVTDGQNGVYFWDGERIENIPSYQVKARETLGAGDVWHGAFALRIAEGSSEADAIQFANAAAALKCQLAGGRSSFPIRQQVDKLLEHL
ncbi:MAG: PfkB family carbohydrate kinase [Rhodobacteraceae bacterium]|nr:PfkB family carbohydrate kinase [Paracoccaceae bacterium]